MATLSRGYTFGSTETVTNAKLHALVDDASVGNIIDADIAANADIDSSKIDFNGADYVTLAGIQLITGAKTFDTTTTFNAPLANSNLAPIATASYVSGLSMYALSSIPSAAGRIPVANLGSGSPSSANYLRGDGSWVSNTITKDTLGISSGSASCPQNTPTSISFPFTYSSAPKVVASAVTTNSGQNAAVMIYSTSTTGAQLVNPNSETLTVNWVAIGTAA